MFQFIPVSEDGIVAIKATGKLTDADYRAFLPELEAVLEETGPVSLLIELDDFQGWEPKAAWDDFKFGMAHEQDFKRIAIVGEKHWQRWMAALGNALTEAKVRFFFRDEIAQAWDWLREADKSSETASESVGREPSPYQHILLATDFSAHAERALHRAVDLAECYRAKLSLLHALENYNYASLAYDPVVVDAADFMSLEQALYEQASKQLKRLQDKIALPKVQAEVIWGSPKETIVSYAKAQQVDLIVLGSHGKRGLARLLGSVAVGVSNSAGCDVLVVKAEP